MLKLFICDVLDNWRKLAPLTGNHCTIKSSKMDINLAYEITLDLFPTLGLWWNKLIFNDNYGILLETQDFKIGFVKSNKEIKSGISGVANITFYSSIWLLQSSKRVANDQYFSGSLQRFISSIDNNFEWFFVSNDVPIQYESKLISNLDLLKDVCELYNYQFLDVGISQYNKPIIVCGFKEDIANYLGPVYVKKQNNSNDFNEDEILIDNLERKFNFNYITHLYTYIDSGSAASSNTRQGLDNNGLVQLSEFPVVYDALRNKYYITNKALLDKSKIPRYSDLAVPIANFTSNNIGDGKVKQNLTVNQVKQNLYLKGVAELKKYGENENLTISFIFKKMFLPGTKLLIDFTEAIQNIDGTELITIDISPAVPYYLRDVKYSEKDFNSFK